jgi:hypothetical protein
MLFEISCILERAAQYGPTLPSLVILRKTSRAPGRPQPTSTSEIDVSVTQRLILHTEGIGSRIKADPACDVVWDALVNPGIIKHYMFGTEVVSDWEKAALLFGRVNGRTRNTRTKEQS